MGFENPYTNPYESGNDNNMVKLLEWAKKSFEIWRALENDTEAYTPTDPEEAASYIEKLTYLKDYNQEKYRDKEGGEFYARIDAYIEKLKEIK